MLELSLDDESEESEESEEGLELEAELRDDRELAELLLWPRLDAEERDERLDTEDKLDEDRLDDESVELDVLGAGSP